MQLRVGVYIREITRSQLGVYQTHILLGGRKLLEMCIYVPGKCFS